MAEFPSLRKRGRGVRRADRDLDGYNTSESDPADERAAKRARSWDLPPVPMSDEEADVHTAVVPGRATAPVGVRLLRTTGRLSALREETDKTVAPGVVEAVEKIMNNEIEIVKKLSESSKLYEFLHMVAGYTNMITVESLLQINKEVIITKIKEVIAQTQTDEQRDIDKVVKRTMNAENIVAATAENYIDLTNEFDDQRNKIIANHTAIRRVIKMRLPLLNSIRVVNIGLTMTGISVHAMLRLVQNKKLTGDPSPNDILIRIGDGDSVGRYEDHMYAKILFVLKLVYTKFLDEFEEQNLTFKRFYPVDAEMFADIVPVTHEDAREIIRLIDQALDVDLLHRAAHREDRHYVLNAEETARLLDFIANIQNVFNNVRYTVNRIGRKITGSIMQEITALFTSLSNFEIVDLGTLDLDENVAELEFSILANAITSNAKLRFALAEAAGTSIVDIQNIVAVDINRGLLNVSHDLKQSAANVLRKRLKFDREDPTPVWRNALYVNLMNQVLHNQPFRYNADTMAFEPIFPEWATDGRPGRAETITYLIRNTEDLSPTNPSLQHYLYVFDILGFARFLIDVLSACSNAYKRVTEHSQEAIGRINKFVRKKLQPRIDATGRPDERANTMLNQMLSAYASEVFVINPLAESAIADALNTVHEIPALAGAPEAALIQSEVSKPLFARLVALNILRAQMLRPQRWVTVRQSEDTNRLRVETLVALKSLRYDRASGRVLKAKPTGQRWY